MMMRKFNRRPCLFISHIFSSLFRIRCRSILQHPATRCLSRILKSARACVLEFDPLQTLPRALNELVGITDNLKEHV
ncbi:hypothetical protein C8R48DRAFT_733485 [Suillus tomentosus]|nr:hypothetical protein C8R48DRAFT_733485 [Suillus tomentosus]